MGAPAPIRPSFNAPTEPMPLDDLPHVHAAPATTALAPPASEPFAPVAPSPESSAAELADSFAAPPPTPARQPRTIMPKTADVPVAKKATTPATPAPAAPVPASGIGGTALPDMQADAANDAAAADDEENRAGPPTLASMLPEDAGEWPPRKKGRKLKAKGSEPKADVAPEAAEPALEVPGRSDPRFLREAKNDARWRKPWVRATLGVSLALLVFAAAAQLAWPQRDMLAARWPETLPAWAWLCEQADCKIEPPRAIASLALDGSSLNRTDTEHVLLFSADLHNRSDHEVRMPSFDVTFMDLNGEIVARKVLSPAQIGIQQAALAADAELHVHARIQVGALDASGFQAEMFYP